MQPNWLSLAQSVMAELILRGVVIVLPKDFVLPTAPQPDEQRVADDPGKEHRERICALPAAEQPAAVMEHVGLKYTKGAAAHPP